MSAFSKIESFLTKAGKAISAGLSIADYFIPVLRPFVGSGAPQTVLNDVAQVAARGTNDLTAIGSTVLQIEGALQGVPGPQKLQAVATLITPIIESAEFLLGTDPGDDAEFNAGVKDMANAVVRIYNSRKPKVNLKNTGTVSVLSAPLATPTPVAPDPAKP